MNIVFILLLVITGALWLALFGCASNAHSSDGAGRGIAQALGLFFAIGLWLALAGVLGMSAAKHAFPRVSAFAVFALHPASVAAAIATLSLLGSSYGPRWLLAVALAPPALMLAYAATNYFVASRTPALVTVLPSVVWGVTAALSLCPWPLMLKRSRENAVYVAQLAQQRQASLAADLEAKRREQQARFEKLTPESPLWEWLSLAEPETGFRDQALVGIRQLPRRQRDAEEMLAHGNAWVLKDLPSLDLQPTPALCEGARRCLIADANSYRQTVEVPPSLSVLEPRIRALAPAVKWLIERGCDCSEVLAAYEAAAKTYSDDHYRTDFLAALEAMRQPSTHSR